MPPKRELSAVDQLTWSHPFYERWLSPKIRFIFTGGWSWYLDTRDQSGRSYYNRHLRLKDNFYWVLSSGAIEIEKKNLPYTNLPWTQSRMKTNDWERGERRPSAPYQKFSINQFSETLSLSTIHHDLISTSTLPKTPDINLHPLHSRS